MRRHGTMRLAIGILGLLVISPAAPARAGGEIEFNRDIRPILSENCYFCHGPDKRQRKSGLRLDERQAALDMEAIVPGKPDDSELVVRIFSDDPDEVMPPAKSPKKLTDAQKDLLRRWIEQGAEYQPHWAYVPPTRPEVPEVAARDRVRNPIDAFILKALEAKGLRPSPEADRRTLLRRLSLDLTGLPPSPEEVRAFVEDQAPDAYERQVDRLLKSPHYGERMAVPWLDLVRFADTVGYHGDQNQRIFPYRDYVIDAFNDNKPFDRFTVEQLAGDLLPDPSPEQLVATGFNRLNMMTREGGAQPKEYLAKYAADRVRTVSTTWLGSTMGCCECHDHKFDPFTAKDFYRLSAFFADVKQWGVYSDYGYTPNPELKGWSNDHPFPPEIEVASPYLERRRDLIKRQVDEVLTTASARLTADEGRRGDFEAWQAASLEYLKCRPDGWAVPPAEVDGDDNTVQPDGSVLLSGGKTEPKAKAKRPKRGDDLAIRLRPEPGRLAAIRLELLPHEEHRGSIVRDGAESTLIRFSATLKTAGKEKALAIAEADADFKEPRYSSTVEVIGVKGAWLTSARRKNSRQAAVYLLERPVAVAEGDELVVTVTSDAAGCVRVSTSPIGREDPIRDDPSGALAVALGTPCEARSPGQDELIRKAYLLGTVSDAGAVSKFRTLRRELLECRDGRAWTMVTRAMEPMTTRVLPRGNWQDESGEVVEPGVPAFLPQPPGDSDRRLTRLDLARWITSPENPLTARVFVNRLWKQFFGAGISGVMDDVGAQGEWPVHPALLDWLAVEFRDGGWDVKHMVRLMVTSSTYRQDSRPRADLDRADPTNRLLARQSPIRLEAEFVRDNALAISGLLNRDLGGPSAFPYQPPGYYENIQFPDRDYVASRDERQYRRGVYAHWQRTFLHPMLANFDAPSREECTASRNVANTPQQALTLLNDPTFVEAARVLAGSILATGPKADEARIDLLYQKAVARPARPAEMRSLVAFLASQRRGERSDADAAEKLLHVGLATEPAVADAPELAAWTNVCRVVLNLHETITRY
jgi:hypothetical protein